MSSHYRVRWEIDIEDIPDITEAIKKAMYYMTTYMQSSVYEVEDRKTGQVYEVDCEPEVWEVTEKSTDNETDK